MDIQIREMRIQDYQPALDLWNRTPGMGLSSADEQEHIHTFLRKNPSLCFVALAGETLVGTILCGEDGRRGYIYHLAVDSRFQKQGIGKELVDRSMQALRALGIQKCHLFVYGDNHSGIAFWAHNGWEMREDIELMSLNL